MSKILKILTGIAVLALAAIIAIAVVVALDDRPLVPQTKRPTAAERAWAAEWIRNAAPGRSGQASEVTLTLSETQANLLGAYLVDRIGPGRVAVEFAPERARLALSVGLPWNPSDRFLNAELDLRTDQGQLRVVHARAAGLPIPAGVAQALVERLFGALDASGLIRQVEIAPDSARITLDWRPGALGTLAGELVPAADRTRILVYQTLLSGHGRRPDARPPGTHSPDPGAVDLADLLSLVLTAAGRAGDADPVKENRAALVALAAYVNGQPIPDQPQPGATGAPDSPPASARPPVSKRPFSQRVQLRGRPDLAKHFTVSAALAALDGSTLADLAGFLKEAADSRHGSGFSFVDLTADRGGTRLGRLAVASRQSARALQASAAHGLTDADIMPDLGGLPEGLSAKAFAAAFRNTDSPAYQGMTELIERRLDALPLFR